MKMSFMFLALLLSTLALSGCASTCKKCSGASDSNEYSPVASSSVVAAQPAAAPAADEVPAAVKQYVNK
jgi:uncharacterized protein YceK